MGRGMKQGMKQGPSRDAGVKTWGARLTHDPKRYETGSETGRVSCPGAPFFLTLPHAAASKTPHASAHPSTRSLNAEAC